MKKIIQRWKSDNAGATLVTGILSFMLLVLCVGFAIDVSKNVYLRDAYQSRAQQTVQASMKSINGKGGLMPEAVTGLYGTYTQGFKQFGENQKDETKSWETDSCHKPDSITLNDGTVVENPQLPYMVITVDDGRARGNSKQNSAKKLEWRIDGNLAKNGKISENSVRAALKGSDLREINNGTYRVLTMEVHDSAKNMMLGMFGFGCQPFSSTASAITFGSNTDLRNTAIKDLEEEQKENTAPPSPSNATVKYGGFGEEGVISGTAVTDEQYDAGWRVVASSITQLKGAEVFDNSGKELRYRIKDTKVEGKFFWNFYNVKTGEKLATTEGWFTPKV